METERKGQPETMVCHEGGSLTLILDGHSMTLAVYLHIGVMPFIRDITANAVNRLQIDGHSRMINCLR